MTALAAADVVVTAGGRRILDTVTFAVDHGEVVALVGPNGAGKSTLLGVLAGDRRPDRGRVTLEDRTLGDWPARQLSRQRAVLPQRSSVAFPFLVRQVVAMGRAPWRGTTSAMDDERAIVEAMAATEVDHLADRTITSLSGGELARVSLARVLCQGTSRLLLDEPAAALDLRHQQLVLGVCRARASDGSAVVLVAHDLVMAGMADRVVVLADGQVVADGAPSKVLTPPLVEQVYRHPVHVLEHPDGGTPVVLPRPT